jgi:hypothetical protein
VTREAATTTAAGTRTKPLRGSDAAVAVANPADEAACSTGRTVRRRRDPGPGGQIRDTFGSLEVGVTQRLFGVHHRHIGQNRLAA